MFSDWPGYLLKSPVRFVLKVALYSGQVALPVAYCYPAYRVKTSNARCAGKLKKPIYIYIYISYDNIFGYFGPVFFCKGLKHIVYCISSILYTICSDFVSF